LIVVVSLAAWALLAPHASIRAADENAGLRLVAYGVIERFAEDGQVRYKLVDERGDAVYEISSRGRLDLARFLGQQVEVMGTLHSAAPGDLRAIRAVDVVPSDKVAPAHFIQIADQRPSREEASVLEDRASSSTNSSQGDSLLEPVPLDSPPPDFPDLPEFPDLPPLTEPLVEPLVTDEGSVVLEAPTESPPPGELGGYGGPVGLNSSCGPKHWIWGETEYLYWATKGTRVPALVTTSEPGTPQEEAGVLGLSSTSILFGNGDLFDSGRNGWRWVFGGWFEPSRRLGMQFDYIGLEDEVAVFRDESNGVEILARPFTNVDPALGPNPVPDSELISFTNATAGSVEVDGWNKFCSFGIHFRGNILFRNGCFYQPGQPCVGNPSGYRVDLLGGYRYLSLEDHLAIGQLTSVSVTPQAGFDVLDQFNTDNNFQGGELGLLCQYYRNRWSVDGVLKFALGRSEPKVSIAGTTDFSMVGMETPFEGGLLALSTNIGNYSRKDTDLISELGLTFGYLLTSNLRVTCGYRVIYWPKVARAGDQIDLTVNGSYIPDPAVIPSGPLRPAFAFQETSFWAQGVSLGVDYRW